MTAGQRHKNPDDASFGDAVRGAKPLRQDRVTPHRKRRRPIPEQTLRDQQEVLRSSLLDDYAPADIETGEELLYIRPGLQKTVIRKFRRGFYAIEAELDLHGKTVPQAREQVDAFLRQAQAMGKRCVRVIHGKGKGAEGKLPVLKGKVNSWLRQRDAVLAFCSARPYDGGTGAVYVLLRRK